MKLSTKAVNLETVEFRDVPPAVVDIEVEPRLVETSSHRRLHQLFARAQGGILALAYGGAGVGKTTAALRYAEGHREYGKTAHYVNMHAVVTPTAMLNTLAETIRLSASFGAYRNVSLMRSIADHLAPGDLLILDESQSLRPDALDMVRFFLDTRGVGIALLGNELVFSAIVGKNRRAMFAQLHSRVGMRLHIPHPTEEDADAVLKAWGVNGGAARDYGRQLALGPGGLRQLTQVLRQARIAAAAKQRVMDNELMYSAACALGLTD